MSPTTLETRAVTYSFDIEIAAPPQVVWQSLTEQIQEWWLPDFHMMSEDSVVVFDPRAGGQLVERSESGGSLLWYSVLMSVPGQSVDLVGHVTAAYGGPATTMLRMNLEETPTGTKLEISDAIVGHVQESMVNSLESGWKLLFGDGLKKHAEAAAK